MFLTNLPITSFLENRRLRDEHAYMEGRISEIYRELHEAKEDIRDLRAYSQGLRRENDELRSEIELLRLSSQEDRGDADIESDGDDYLRERKKRKTRRNRPKNSKNVNSSDDSDTEDNLARVRLNSYFYTIRILFLLIFYYNIYIRLK